MNREETAMLGKNLSADWFKHNLIPRNRWQPYPRYADRRAWKSLPAGINRKAILTAARAVQHQPWPSLPATLYLQFARTGNRANYEAAWFERRQQLNHLVLAHGLRIASCLSPERPRPRGESPVDRTREHPGFVYTKPTARRA